MRCGALVMTYRRPEILRRTLEIHLAQTRPPDLILVADNGRCDETAEAVRSLGERSLVYLAMPDNVGPAGAGAHGLGWLLARDYDWIYWGGDDDPPQTGDIFAALLSLAQTAPDDVAAVGVVGSRWDWRRGEQRRPLDRELVALLEVDVIGSNQQLWLRREAVASVGLPEERFFFGLEEVEYCLRLRRAGFRLLVDGPVMREHRLRAGRLGLGPRPRSLLPRQARGSLWRRYYSTRNYIYMMNRLFGRPDLARREAAKAAIRCLMALSAGSSYARAFAELQLAGVRDGYRERLGRRFLPALVENRYQLSGGRGEAQA